MPFFFILQALIPNDTSHSTRHEQTPFLIFRNFACRQTGYNMKKRLILPLTIALAALIGGCIWHFLSDRKGTMQLLEQAEAVMREHPDSAYRLLCGIDSTRQLRGESRARYALLMTQAQYKNGVPLPNDSLIRKPTRCTTLFPARGISWGKHEQLQHVITYIPTLGKSPKTIYSL